MLWAWSVMLSSFCIMCITAYNNKFNMSTFFDSYGPPGHTINIKNI